MGSHTYALDRRTAETLVRASDTPHPCHNSDCAIVRRNYPNVDSKTGKAITISPPPKLRFGHNSANSARSRRPLHRKMKIINSTVGYECTRMEWIMPRLHQMVDILYEATTVHFTCNWNIYQTEYGCWNNDIDTTRTKNAKSANDGKNESANCDADSRVFITWKSIRIQAMRNVT